MNLSSLSVWIPSLTVSGLLGVALWLSRSIIETRLRASVQGEFDAKLEVLKGDIRSSEERLGARLREKEAELEALRSGALSAMTSRQVVLDNRRLEAVDQLWSAYTELKSDVAVARTENRSVLGQMVDFAKMLPFYLPESRWTETDLRVAEDRLAETPCRAGGRFEHVIFPRETTVRLLESKWCVSPARFINGQGPM